MWTRTWSRWPVELRDDAAEPDELRPRARRRVMTFTASGPASSARRARRASPVDHQVVARSSSCRRSDHGVGRAVLGLSARAARPRAFAARAASAGSRSSRRARIVRWRLLLGDQDLVDLLAGPDAGDPRSRSSRSPISASAMSVIRRRRAPAGRRSRRGARCGSAAKTVSTACSRLSRKRVISRQR